MARPKKTGLDYFPHDTDAVNDEKIEILRTFFENDGYAFYFIMLERIYRTNKIEIDISDAETREETYQILSRKIAVSKEKFIRMLNLALKHNIFDKCIFEKEGKITSNGIKKRAEVVLKKRLKMREIYDSLVSASETREETTPETPQSKVKKSKVKKSKVNNYNIKEKEIIKEKEKTKEMLKELVSKKDTKKNEQLESIKKIIKKEEG